MQSTEDIQVQEVDSDAVLMRLERAQDEIDRLSESRTNWRWSIPANPDRDSDLILSDSVRDVAALLAALAVERDRADRAEARIAELQQPRSLHLYADECTGGYFLRDASASEKRTLHRFVQEIQSPRVFPEATA